MIDKTEQRSFTIKRIEGMNSKSKKIFIKFPKLFLQNVQIKIEKPYSVVLYF